MASIGAASCPALANHCGSTHGITTASDTCHNAHGSTNARLLKRPVVFTVCLECHNGLANFGRRLDGPQNPSASHNLADPRYQNCSTCHVRIHGSNGSQLFFR